MKLLEAIRSSGPGRHRRIGTAARWYLGVPQIFLSNKRNSAGNKAIIERRLTQFLAGDFTGGRTCGPCHQMAPRPFWEAPRVATIIFGCGLTRGFYSPTFISLSTLAKSPWLFQNCSVPV